MTCTSLPRSAEDKTAGYSKKSLLDKLGLEAGMRACLVAAVYKAPAGVQLTREAPLDFVHLFTKDRLVLEREFGPLAKALGSTGILWVSWPKRASKVLTNLSEAVVREIGLRAGLVDVKVCAVDDVWSGLKFVIRLKNR